MDSFSGFKDPRTGFCEIPIQDFLLSSYAIFALKYPSLLSFENDMVDEKKFHNLKSLFGVLSGHKRHSWGYSLSQKTVSIPS